MFSRSTALLLVVLGLAATVYSAGIRNEVLQSTKAGAIFIGEWYVHGVQLYKLYYKGDTMMTWEASQEFCFGERMQPVAIQDPSELQYLAANANLTAQHYWTSGSQQISIIWQHSIPIPADIPSWCVEPGTRYCVSLHTTAASYHALTCDESHYPLCEIATPLNKKVHGKFH